MTIVSNDPVFRDLGGGIINDDPIIRVFVAPLFGETFETTSSFQSSIDSGGVDDGEPAYIEEDSTWAINYGGTAVKLTYPDRTSYQDDIDAGLIPEGSFTYIPDDNGNFVPTVNEGGTGVPAGSVSTGGNLCAGDTTNGSNSTRQIVGARATNDPVDTVDQISIGSI